MCDDPGFAGRLREWARSDPGRVAIREAVPRSWWTGNARTGWQAITFGGLDQLADRYASRLERAGVRAGDYTLYFLRPSIQGYAVFYGLLRIGAVPIFIDPRMPLPRLLACVAEAAPRILVGVPEVHALRLVARRSFAATEIALSSGRAWPGVLRLADGLTESHAGQKCGVDPSSACYVAYTSGSTGIAKGVPYSRGMIGAQMSVVHSVCDWSAGMPVVMCFAPFVPYALGDGLTAILPAMDFSRPGAARAERIVEAIVDHAAPCAFASPRIWLAVSAWCDRRKVRLPTLSRAVTVGAPVQPSLHRSLVPLLHPDGHLYTPYGATEAMPIATTHSGALVATWEQTRAGYGTCVGPPMPGVEVHVVRVTNAPVPEWSDELEVDRGLVGELVVGGEVVSTAYLRRPHEDEGTKIRRGDRIMHRTGDLGRHDADGRLWFCGRKSQRVEHADVMLPADAVENIFNEHPLVVRSALVGIGSRGGQTPVVCVELKRGARLTRALASELATMAGVTPFGGAVSHFLQHSRFPVDQRHNAKILREDLARWAERHMPDSVRP